MLEFTKIVENCQDGGQDRIEIIQRRDGVILVLADGAGGSAGGAEAAEELIAIVKAYASQCGDFEDRSKWEQLLRDADRRISLRHGETTGVIAAIAENSITGASVGDSSAWIIGKSYDDLTSGQLRKPLIGSGRAHPVAFQRKPFAETVLLASDGLIKYATPARVCEIVRSSEFKNIASGLVDLVRLKSGAMPDDVSVIVCRKS
jgi:serine/threonine protein phosphatase PrpC